MAERGVFYCIRDCNIKDIISDLNDSDPSLTGDHCLVRYGEMNENLVLLFVDKRWHRPEKKSWFARNFPSLVTAKAEDRQAFIDPLVAVQASMKKRQLNWMTLFVQEGSIWEYIAYHGEIALQQFSTCRAYWGDDDDDQDQWMGNPQQLASMFDVQASRIEKYLIPWGLNQVDSESLEFQMRGAAYPDDESCYGEIHQYCDFLRALGFAFPDQVWNASGFNKQH